MLSKWLNTQINIKMVEIALTPLIIGSVMYRKDFQKPARRCMRTPRARVGYSVSRPG